MSEQTPEQRKEGDDRREEEDHSSSQARVMIAVLRSVLSLIHIPESDFFSLADRVATLPLGCASGAALYAVSPSILVCPGPVAGPTCSRRCA